MSHHFLPLILRYQTNRSPKTVFAQSVPVWGHLRYLFKPDSHGQYTSTTVTHQATCCTTWHAKISIAVNQCLGQDWLDLSVVTFVYFDSTRLSSRTQSRRSRASSTCSTSWSKHATHTNKCLQHLYWKCIRFHAATYTSYVFTKKTNKLRSTWTQLMFNINQPVNICWLLHCHFSISPLTFLNEFWPLKYHFHKLGRLKYLWYYCTCR